MTDTVIPDPALAPEHPAVRAWQAHLDARRLGSTPPIPPEVAATRDATTALFRGIAQDRRTLARAVARAFAAAQEIAR